MYDRPLVCHEYKASFVFKVISLSLSLALSSVLQNIFNIDFKFLSGFPLNVCR